MWSRTFAALLPGFLLAAALTGLACWLPPGPWTRAIYPALIAFFPIWTAVATSAFACRTARRAWSWIGGLAMAAWAAFWLLKTTQWLQ